MSQKTPRSRAVQLPPSDQTRAALVHAALKLFGAKGFEGTSTREIAALAKANIGSIAYHFGGKGGLRAACAEHIVATIRGIAAPVVDAEEQASAPRMGREAAQRRLRAVIETMVSFLVGRPEAGEIAQFVMREMAHPSPALDIIYRGVFEPLHKQFCRIWAAATGEDPESELTRITIFMMIGQIVYFRIGREVVKRRMGWSEIGAEEAARIASVATGNLDAVLAARRTTASDDGEEP